MNATIFPDDVFETLAILARGETVHPELQRVAEAHALLAIGKALASKPEK